MKTFVAVPVFLMMMSLAVPSGAAEENPFSIYVDGSYTLPSDIKGQVADITEFGFDIRLGYSHTFDNGIPLSIKAGGDHFFWEHDSPVDFPEKAKSRGVWIKSEVPIPGAGENFLFGLELNPGFQSAKGAQFYGDTFRFKFTPVIHYKSDSSFEFVVGAEVRPEYDFPVLPVVGFNYQLTDDVFINLVSDRPNISYRLSDQTKLLWNFDFLLDEYEVTEGTFDGFVIEQQRFMTGLGIDHRFHKNVRAHAGINGVFSRILKYQDGSGKIVPDPGVRFNFGIDIEF